MILVIALVFLSAVTATAGTTADTFAGALNGLAPQNKPCGLLLGVRNEDGLQTLFVEHSGAQATLAAGLPLLAVPQQNGFLYLYKRAHTSVELTDSDLVPEERVVYREHWEEVVVEHNRATAEREAEQAVPEDTVLPSPCRDCPVWTWSDYIDIGYVVPGHVTLKLSGSGYTGGAHPNSYTNAFTVRSSSLMSRVVNATNRDVDTPDNLAESELADLYPVARDPGITTRMQRELYIRGRLEYFIDMYDTDTLYEAYDSTEYADVSLASIDGLYEVDTTAISLVLERRNGRVHLLARADASAGYAESGDYALTAEYDCGALASTVAPFNECPLDYAAFVRADRSVRDVLVAPTHDIVYVLVDDTLLGFDAATRRQVFEYLLPEASQIVMVEWATGAQLEAWKKSLR